MPNMSVYVFSMAVVILATLLVTQSRPDGSNLKETYTFKRGNNGKGYLKQEDVDDSEEDNSKPSIPQRDYNASVKQLSGTGKDGCWHYFQDGSGANGGRGSICYHSHHITSSESDDEEHTHGDEDHTHADENHTHDDEDHTHDNSSITKYTVNSAGRNRNRRARSHHHGTHGYKSFRKAVLHEMKKMSKSFGRMFSFNSSDHHQRRCSCSHH